VKLDDFVLETYQGRLGLGLREPDRRDRPRHRQELPGEDLDEQPAPPPWLVALPVELPAGGGREATVLSVSKDPGQLVVFAGYATLVLGMILVLLTRVSQSREREAFEAKVAAGGMSLPTMGRPLLLALLLLPLATSARAEALPASSP